MVYGLLSGSGMRSLLPRLHVITILLPILGIGSAVQVACSSPSTSTESAGEASSNVANATAKDRRVVGDDDVRNAQGYGYGYGYGYDDAEPEEEEIRD